MSTELHQGSRGNSLTQFLRGSIEAGELSRAILDEMPAAAGVYASPAKKAPLSTKEKTCKPTRNPCCKVQGTQAKTCKPTRNPCCKVEGTGTQAKTCKPTRNPCCKVEGTKEKTCKPTRNPCCKPKPTGAKKARNYNEDFFGGSPAGRLSI